MKKIVVVTGATRGIGRAIAIGLAKADYEVHGVFTASDDQAQELNGEYGIIFHRADLSDRDQALWLVEELSRLPIDGLVNNAGMWEADDFNTMDLAVWDKTLAVNLTAPLILTQQLSKTMSKGASVINIASTDGMMGAFDGISYSVSKAGLINLTKSLANHLGPRGIRVNAIAPGWIDTEMVTDAPIGMSAEMTPLGRNGTPEEVSDLVEFLLSEKSRFIHGETIVIDGGLINVDYILKKEAE